MVVVEVERILHILDPIRTFWFACFQTALLLSFTLILFLPLFHSLPFLIIFWLSLFLCFFSFVFLTTRFFHLTTPYQIVSLLSLVRMFLKSKQIIQTCRIRKYIILHNVVRYVTAGLIFVDCLLFDC